MWQRTTSIVALAATLALFPVAGCDFDIGDLNNPAVDELQLNPTRVAVGAACTGLLIGNRRNRGQANGYIAQLGILGREAYNFDQADPRFIGELLEGSLQPGSPFGGNFWTAPYANIRLANIVESVADKVPDYSLAEVYAVTGFAKTIEATDLLEVAVTRDSNGGVIDTDHDVDAALGAVVGRDQMLMEVARLLDEADGPRQGRRRVPVHPVERLRRVR
jgi:starch-binding outer membrane protein, SusD/RagB family